MSDERAELVHLVHQLPDHQVPTVLAALRRFVVEPANFASAPSDGPSAVDRLLDGGLGR